MENALLHPSAHTYALTYVQSLVPAQITVKMIRKFTVFVSNNKLNAEPKQYQLLFYTYVKLFTILLLFS